MNFPRRTPALILIYCAIRFSPANLVAQNSNLVSPNAVAGAAAPPLPPTPALRSPVALFRGLLAMNPIERKQSLAGRSEENQMRILDKLREYQSLPPDDRELRLRTTELQWYLEHLMSLHATNRADLLATIPAEDRKLVESRLEYWDILPPPLQKEILENEMMLRYLARIESSTEEEKQKILAEMSPAQRAKLEAGIDQWNKLSDEQRRQKLDRVKNFFELTPKEKRQALNTLSEAERRQIEKTLATYQNLPPQERAACIRSFEKFATMSLADRQEFLKNAERWSAMSPDERQALRNLVAKLHNLPPLPPGLGMPPIPRLPPLPSRAPVSVVATNGD